MTIEELMELRRRNDAPYNHEEYTVWLHNQIVDKIKEDIWKLREQRGELIGYAALTNAMAIPALQKAKFR